ncbi:MAG: DUF1638 domain-containing protein [Candidatus Bathyarchaeia archaeon]|jgi:hypothetical protein
MLDETKPCLISCSVLKEEIQQLIKDGELSANTVFVSKYFHVDFNLIEKNLRRVIPQTLQRFPAGAVLVYGDLCLGMNGEMKQLADEYGIVKVDALNCTDCILGGKGASLNVDPEHNLLVLSPGLIDFFQKAQDAARQQNVDEETLKQLFSGMKGIVLLDTLGEADKNRADIEKIKTGLPILETKTVGRERLKQVLLDALEKSRQKTSAKPT